MATKKKTEKDELTKVDTTHADVNDGMAAPEQETLSEMEKVNATAQDHITVVIPYCREFAQGRELLYALRSWQENVRFGINVVVIGDREAWFSEEITFIEHQRVSDNAQVDTLAKLRIAVASPEVTGYFIWSNDDIYVMNPVSLPHIALPKVSGKLVPMRFKGLYAENMKQTAMLLEKNGLPCLNYETHTPVLFDKERLIAMFERFPELEKGGYLFTSVYYNSHPYPTQPVYLDWKTDQVLLPVVSQSPDENKVVDILSRKVFMNNTVSGYSSWLEKFLDKCFPVSSDFEN